MTRLATAATIVLATLSLAIAEDRESLPGAKNYTRVDATVACGGATGVEAFPELRARGFAAVVNLREAGEPGADIDGASRAAQAQGLRYLHIPLSSRNPGAGAFDTFLDAMKDPANSPVYIHCASANRVGAALIPYFMIDRGMSESDAVDAAMQVGLRNAGLMEWGLDYARRHPK